MTDLELVLSYKDNATLRIESVLRDCLATALEQNLVDADEPSTYLSVDFIRQASAIMTDDGGEEFSWAVAGLMVDLPPEIDARSSVIADFCATVCDLLPDSCVVKFEDGDLLKYLSERSVEIYGLEMKLRRVLSIIYLSGRERREPYSLLCDESVQPAKDLPNQDRLRAVTQNELFYLTFSQYSSLNRRPDPKLPDIVRAITKAESISDLRDELLRPPIEHEDDALLIAGLAARMDPIEQMRNCVAHNRSPSTKVEENYNNALPLVHQMLDEYLDRLSLGD